MLEYQKLPPQNTHTQTIKCRIVKKIRPLLAVVDIEPTTALSGKSVIAVFSASICSGSKLPLTQRPVNRSRAKGSDHPCLKRFCVCSAYNLCLAEQNHLTGRLLLLWFPAGQSFDLVAAVQQRLTVAAPQDLGLLVIDAVGRDQDRPIARVDGFNEWR